jgi:hypothetical protein
MNYGFNNAASSTNLMQHLIIKSRWIVIDELRVYVKKFLMLISRYCTSIHLE